MNPKMQKKEREIIQDGYRYALSLTHDRDDAQDLIQEAWLKIHETDKHPANIRALLYSVIRNIFIDNYRRNKRFPQDSSQIISDPHNPEKLLIDNIRIKNIELCLAELKPHEREVLFLKCFEEYTAKEISDITGEPRGTILSLIHRARQKIMKLMGENEENDKIIPFKRRQNNE